MYNDGNDLIGTKYNPPGFDSTRIASRVAKAYHKLMPYPNFSPMTKDWKTEERGPLPRCMALPRNLVKDGAKWLFGKPITFRCPDAKSMNDTINETWTNNNMNARSKAMAVIGALSGGVALKWSYDEDDGGAKIHVIDPAEYTRFYWDPDDILKLLMVRVQYPRYDATTGKTSWIREDWTDEYEQQYEPLESKMPGGFDGALSLADMIDASDQWKKKAKKPNQFGVIPFWYIKNIETGAEIGEGDLWSVYHLIDLVNFNRDLELKNNQKALDPDSYLIDLTAPTGDAPGSGSPMREIPLESKNGTEGPQGKVQMVQPDPALRPHLRQYIEDIKTEILNSVGGVDIDEEKVTNKGALTSAVMSQLYAPLISATDEKRTTYGEDGLCVFFERMSGGLATCGAKDWQEVEDVQIHWSPYFSPTPEEQIENAQYQTALLGANLTTHERAVRAIASEDGVIDVDKLVQAVTAEKAEADAKKEERFQMQNAPEPEATTD